MSYSKLLNAIKVNTKLKNNIKKNFKVVEVIKNQIFRTLSNKGKIFLCGNGGSAADAQHLAAELMVRLRPKINRNSYPVISLALDVSTLTACSNDYGYKNIFSSLKDISATEANTPFTRKYLTHLFKQEDLSGKSMGTDIIIMIRTRFILDWYNDNSVVLPFKLFEFHRNLLREGLFVAYNQWLIGAVENPSRYQRWTESHTREYNAFNQYRQSNLFKMPAGQYYRLMK